MIRGLENGPLRVTSVAMTNTPAINNLDALAASANIKPATGGKETMGKLEKALSRLLGRESIALEAETKEEEKDIQRFRQIVTRSRSSTSEQTFSSGNETGWQIVISDINWQMRETGF